MNKTLVLGGCGFVGSVLVQKLVEQGISVHVYDSEEPNLPIQSVEYTQGDILDYDSLSEVMSGCNVVYHLAAHLPVAHNKTKSLKETLYEANVEGTKSVLRAARENSVRRIVYTSSTAIYGMPDRNPIDGDTPFKPVEEYGISKVLAEEECEKFSREGNDVMIIRPCPVIGPGRLGVFQILFEWIYRGWNVPILGSGKNILQFIHVEDCANAILAVGMLPHKPNRYTAYNVGANELISLREGLENLILKVGSKSKVRSLPKMPIIVAVSLFAKLRLLPLSPFHALIYGESVYSSNKSAQVELSWEPSHGFSQILEDGYKWYYQNRTQVLNNQTGSVHQRAPKQGLLSLVRFLP